MRSKRTTLIAAAAVLGVALAGAVAIAANLGVLDAASPGDLGQLSAATATSTARSQATIAPPAGTTQPFVVDVAGTVRVDTADGRLTLGEVTANPGWTYAPGEASATRLAVTFQGEARTIVFTATLSPDGTVAASIEEAASAPPATLASHGGDDDHGHESEVEDD